MKVVCINAANITDRPGVPQTPTRLKEGGTYTVVEEMAHPVYGDPGYILSEIKSDGYRGGFMRSRFIPLSTIDEMELLEQRQEQYA